ncbi:MAG: histidine kinase [Acidipropionibacterium sp.]|nr:histidine kinase [Acidipropionibacterium sp.]
MAITVSCIALLFNLDDLVAALERLGSPGSLLDFLYLLICAAAVGVVCWFPRAGALLLWIAIPLGAVSGDIALLIIVGPIICITVTAVGTLRFVGLDAAALVLGTIALTIRWTRWSHNFSPILWTGAILLAASTALGLVLRAVLNARSERRRQEKQLIKAQKRAEEAAEQERQRLAHDMHDYVAHELTVIVAALAAARARREAGQQDAERDAELMQTLEQTSRKALDELRRVLRLLDGDDGELIPGSLSYPPSLSPVPGDRHGDEGESVAALVKDAAKDLQVIGDEVEIAIDPDVAELSPTSEQRSLLQRFLSEAVTNVVKHGGHGSRVRIRANTVADGWQVSLANTLMEGASGPEESTGLGIPGLRREAASLGCEVSAGPISEDHEWMTTLTVPGRTAV